METKFPKIYVSTSSPADTALTSDGYIWIQPINHKWNDFGHKTIANISYYSAASLAVAYEAKVAIKLADSNKFIGVGNLPESVFTRGIFEATGATIFSLAATQQDYRDIVRRLGPVEARAFLGNVNDLLCVFGKKEMAPFERQIRNSEVYSLSIVRTSEAYFALKNSGPILNGLQFEEVSRGPEQVIAEVPGGSRNGEFIRFSFDHSVTLPKRTCVIIGKNGVGKSRILGDIARSAIKGTVSEGQNRIVASRILAFTPGNEHTGTFPGATNRNPATYYRRLSTSRTRNSPSQGTATSSILQLSHYNEKIAGRSRLDIFLESIAPVHKANEISLQYSGATTDGTFVSRLRGRSEQQQLQLLAQVNENIEPRRFVNGRYFHLSTGELRFLKLIAQMCMFIENGSLLLIDEPETHLHPNFISHIMSSIESILANTGSCAIIATHSAYVVREVFHNQVTILEKDENNDVCVKFPGMRTFGADVASISTFVFGEEGPTFLARDSVNRLIKTGLTFDEIVKKFGGHLSRELLSEIRSKIENLK